MAEAVPAAVAADSPVVAAEAEGSPVAADSPAVVAEVVDSPVVEALAEEEEEDNPFLNTSFRKSILSYKLT